MKTIALVTTQILDLTQRRRQADDLLNDNLVWWSEMTKQEKHMLTLTIDEIKDTLLMAVFASNDDSKLIAAAGIFQPRTWSKSQPYYNGKKVVEIGTNYVLPEYRNQGIGTQLIEERLAFAKKQDWVAVSISSNQIVQKAFVNLNGSLMENDPECSDLIDLLCLRCKDNREDCSCCPIVPNCGWIFK